MARVQINIRSEDTLRDKLTNIAQQEGISLNELSVQILTNFVEEYMLNKNKENSIPSREEAIFSFKTAKEEYISSCRNSTRSIINNMVRSLKTKVVINFFDDIDYPYEISLEEQKEVSDIIAKELVQLGYFVFKFTEYGLNNEDFNFTPVDLGVSLNAEGLEYFQKINEKAALPPI